MIVNSFRYRHEIIEYDDKLIVFGGGQLDDAFLVDRLPTFDLKKKTWGVTHTNPDLNSKRYPQRRKCHVTQKIDNCKLLILHELFLFAVDQKLLLY